MALPDTKVLPTPKSSAVDPKEWVFAKRYFEQNPDKVKMTRKRGETTHSFLRVNGQIYAMSLHEYLGFGGFSKVKTAVQDNSGESFALKIEGEVSASRKMELEISERMGLLQGTTHRILENAKPWRGGKNITVKNYTVQKLIKNPTLQEYLKDNSGLSQGDKLLIALEVTKAIQKFHVLGYIHGDIKPDNIFIEVKNGEINIIPFDYGFTVKANKKGEGQGQKHGSGKYTPKEVNSKGAHSFSSDAYSLGAMFREDFGLRRGFQPFADLMRDEPNKRPTLSAIEAYVAAELKLPPKLEKAKEEPKPVIKPIEPVKAKEEAAPKPATPKEPVKAKEEPKPIKPKEPVKAKEEPKPVKPKEQVKAKDPEKENRQPLTFAQQRAKEVPVKAPNVAEPRRQTTKIIQSAFEKQQIEQQPKERIQDNPEKQLDMLSEFRKEFNKINPQDVKGVLNRHAVQQVQGYLKSHENSDNKTLTGLAELVKHVQSQVKDPELTKTLQKFVDDAGKKAPGIRNR